MTQATETRLITLAHIEDLYQPGMVALERNDRWFMIAALADRLLSGLTFEVILDRLDPDAKLPVEVGELLCSLEEWTYRDIYALQLSIIKHIIREDAPEK